MKNNNNNETIENKKKKNRKWDFVEFPFILHARWRYIPLAPMYYYYLCVSAEREGVAMVCCKSPVAVLF